ncbi:M23 family metallopeptidase [Candidatus Daviesbacteria bacterium]|nr:M23 family metallopeptidase [Candidatus Daviesbacteria bacterium]
MKKQTKNNQIFSKLTILAVLSLFLSGYHPALSFPPVELSDTLAHENQEQKEEILASSFREAVILPHPGYLSTRYSTFHPGVDIASGLGMPIHPINPGQIIETGRDFFGLGNYIIISHENGFKSKYAHLGKIFVKKNQPVNTENTLGEVGMTGNTSGPHTHLEITLNGNFIDPQTILPEIPPIPQQTLSKK